jgi:hypothetical protein
MCHQLIEQVSTVTSRACTVSSSSSGRAGIERAVECVGSFTALVAVGYSEEYGGACKSASPFVT